MSFRGRQGSHHEPYWDLIKRIVKESDLVLEILDARLVEMSRNESAEAIINESGRPFVFVINKTDLVSKDYLMKQVEELKKIAPVVYISTKIKGSSKILLYTIKKIFAKYGKRPEEEVVKGGPKKTKREAKANIVVGVVGYPNVGKSSIINRIAYRKKAKVGKRPGTTHGPHWITANNDIKFIDTPGVIPLARDDEIRYGLIGARESFMLKNPDVVAYSIIKLFYEKNKKFFEDYYNVLLNEDSVLDPDIPIQEIGRKRRFLQKGNNVDMNRTAMMIVKDWQEGKLKL